MISLHETVLLVMFCLFDLGLTSLSTIFQSYRDGVWMWQGAQCSLLECCLTEILCPRHFDMIFHPVTLYWHWADQFRFLALLSSCWAPSERAASTIFKVFGMTRPGIEPATSRSQSGRSTTEPLCRYSVAGPGEVCYDSWMDHCTHEIVLGGDMNGDLRSRGYKIFSCSNQLSLIFFLLINFKFVTIAKSFVLNIAQHVLPVFLYIYIVI